MLCLESFLSDDQFQCFVCLQVFDNPVSTPCGHSFCMNCIGSYWNRVKLYQCPLCKKSFKTKPELHINRTLREITEQFKQMRAEAGACGAQRNGIEGKTVKQKQMPGDLYVAMKRRLSKPLITEAHEWKPLKMQQSEEEEDDDADTMQHPRLMKKVSLRRFSLSGPAYDSKIPLCGKHHQKLDRFCKSDRECICAECGTLHQSHVIVAADKEWLNIKAEIGITETKMQEMIELRQRKMEEIKISLEEIKISSERETQNSVKVFGTLMSFLEHCQEETLEGIKTRKHSAEHQAEGMIRELELELTSLKKRSEMLCQLSQTDDCISGLRNYNDLSALIPLKDWTEVSLASDRGEKAICSTFSQLLDRFQEELQRLQETCLTELSTQSALNSQTSVKKIQEYAVNLALDPSTAHPRLILSEDKKQVRCGDKHQLVTSNPERFDCMVCVLGQESFSSGRHYWEVEVVGKTDWDLGVASHSINKKGKITFTPNNGYWLLSLRNKNTYAFGTELHTIPFHQKPHKIGVFIDFEKGQVSFFNVEANIHIYTFDGMFCDTVHPFFSPCTNKSGKNEAPLTITTVIHESE